MIMENLYNNELYNTINARRVKLRNIYIVLLVISLLLVASGIVYISLLPYDTKTEKVLTPIIITFTALFSIFSFIYFSRFSFRLYSFESASLTSPRGAAMQPERVKQACKLSKILKRVFE